MITFLLRRFRITVEKLTLSHLAARRNRHPRSSHCRALRYFSFRCNMVIRLLIRFLMTVIKTRMNPRGRLRHSRNLRVATTEEIPDWGWGPQSGRVRRLNLLKKPIFSVFSRVLATGCSIALLQTTDKICWTDKIWPIWRLAGTCFRIPKTHSVKIDPNAKSLILIRSRLKNISGFSSVVGSLLIDKLHMRRNNLHIHSV